MADRLILAPPQAMHQMIGDLNAVARAPTEAIRQLSQLLSQQVGFLTDKKLAALVSQCFEDEVQRAATFNALQNLHPDSLEEVLQTIHAWRAANQQNLQIPPDHDYAELKQKLHILIQEYPALQRMRKAERLRVALGNEFKGVAFICDARPVYNESRDRIEGMIPLSTMKIVYERQNGDTEEIEITMTCSQLDDLIAEARKAQRELPVLRESIAGWIANGCVDPEE